MKVATWTICPLAGVFLLLMLGPSASGQAKVASSFDELTAAYAQAAEAKRGPLVVEWLADRDIQTLDDVSQVAWLCDKVAREGQSATQFTARWSGQITSPQGGGYTLSVSPINVNLDRGRHFVKQSVSVWVGGRKVLEATPKNWAWQSQPVSLKGGKAEAIRVELSYARCPGVHMQLHPAIIALNWAGAGGKAAAVPASALTLPDADAGGLEVEYRLGPAESATVVAATEPQIDRAWFGTYAMFPEYPQLQSKLLARFLDLALDPSYLALWDVDQKPAEGHAFWQTPTLLELMNSSQQQKCMDAMLARPAILTAHPQQSTVGLYWTARGGAPDQALQLLGTWAQVHADFQPELDAPYKKGRQLFELLPEALAWQYPAHLAQFEKEYLLATSDGGCSLPAALILAYAYRQQGGMSQWIEKLDSNLAALPPTGDERVNWLLARAHAEEIRFGRGGRFFPPAYRSLAGQNWLESAVVAAESEPARLRAYQEILWRLVSRERYEAARTILDQAAEKLKQPSSVAALAALRQQVDRIAADLQTREAEAEILARQRYVDRLQARYQKAADAGREDAAARYRQVLTVEGAAPK